MPKSLKAPILSVFCFVLFSCGMSSKQTVSAIENGNYKIDIRSQEFSNSGIHNIDICVSYAQDKKFPELGKGAQCFFHGFDLSGLSVKWTSGGQIEVSFKDGYVSTFRNYAIIPNGLHPIEFRVFLYERGRRTEPKGGGG